jgi:molybdate transport system permease protein
LPVLLSTEWLIWVAAVQLFVPEPTSAIGVPEPGRAVPVTLVERGAEQATEPTPEALVVMAASSLQDVLPVVARAWEDRGGVPVRFSFDATSRLAPQVLRGAPVDVFISADDAWMGWLEERGGVDSLSIRHVATNQLVFVVPSGVPDPPGDPGSIARAALGRIALAGENVPAGRYARAALESVGAWSAVEPRVVRGGSVRGTLEWVARGEVDGGVVYRSDAWAEDRVSLAFVFEGGDLPSPRYSGAVAARTEFRETAEAFLDFMTGAEAAAVLSASGFGPASAGGAVQQDPVPASGLAGSSELHPWSAVQLSLIVALSAVLLGFVPAVAMGWLLARREFLGKSFVSMIIMAPLVVPPVVTGFLLLSVLGRESALGGLLAAIGLPIPFTLLGATLAALVVGFPLYVMAIRAVFDTVDRRFEEVSWTLGVPKAPTFRRISLPLALPGIAAGAVLAFARALGEFGATVVLAGNMEGETRTIALAVYSLLESPSGREATWILVIASVVLSLVALLGFESLTRWQRRRIEDHHGG